MDNNFNFNETRNMLGAMTRLAERFTSNGFLICASLEDIRLGRIGFHVTYKNDHGTMESQNLWTKLSNGDPTRWDGVLRTPQGREWVAVSNALGYPLWQCHDPRDAPSTNRKPWSEDLVRC